MCSLKSPSPLKHPQTHIVLPSPTLPHHRYLTSGKEIEVHGSGSPWFFPVILAWLAGLPQFQVPSAVLLGSPVLNPNPHGTFWATSKSPFTPFLPAESLLPSSKLLRKSSASLLHLAFQLPKLFGKGSTQSLMVSPSVDLFDLNINPGR